MIIEAILKINPNAVVSVTGDNIDTCTIEWLEGTTPISKLDIEAQIPTVEAEIEQKKQDAINKKTSAKQKLLDLGLTEEEIKLTFGV